MEVIGVGMGRTGTLSLKLALEELGFGPCYHMREVMDRHDRIRSWKRIGDGAPADWDEVYRGFRSSVDWPGAAYWRELADAYPKAKLILTVRDADKWYDSALKTIFRFPLRRHNAAQRFAYAFCSTVNPIALAIPNMLDRVWNKIFDGRQMNGPEDRKAVIAAFLQHNEEIKASVDAERLLVYEISEGWEPLCAFLDVPVPQTPFPQVWEAQAFIRDSDARVRKAIYQITAGSVAAVAVVALGVAAATRGWL